MSDTLTERRCAGCGKDISKKNADAVVCGNTCLKRKKEGRFVPYKEREGTTCADAECDNEISHRRLGTIFCSRTCNARWMYHENRFKLWQYLLEHPCVECGEDNPVLLEFDHLNPKTKKKAIARMLTSNAWVAIAKEIAKCQVLCVKCHRLLTAQQQGWYDYTDWLLEASEKRTQARRTQLAVS